MIEYTYKDVVTIKDIMTGEVDKEILIGKKGWVGDCIKDVIGMANRNDCMDTLDGIDEDLHAQCPFISGGVGFIYFVPSKNQDAPNDDTEDRPLRKGDFVRMRGGEVGVCMTDARHGKDEIIDIWFAPGNCASTIAYNLTRVDGHFEPIDFTDRNVRREFMGMMVEMDADSYGLAGRFECVVTGFHVSGHDVEIGLSVSDICHGRAFSAEEFLENCRFQNGVPCGRPVGGKEE